MLCYHCQKVNDCSTFRTLYSTCDDFSINKCKDYDTESKYKYKKIASNDELMHLIYDYFTCQVDGNYSEEEIKNVITHAILML